jgi:putative flippase GtrA
MIAGKLAGGSTEAGASVATSPWSRSRALAQRLPRLLRFPIIGGLGLAADIVLFTVIAMHGVHSLLAGFLALAGATVLTWRVNRAFTFERSGRRQREGAWRYAAVTAAAQSTSYAVFAVLVSTALAALPQAAIVVGAAAGALISYNGHRLFAFAPLQPSVGVRRS